MRHAAACRCCSRYRKRSARWPKLCAALSQKTAPGPRKDLDRNACGPYQFACAPAWPHIERSAGFCCGETRKAPPLIKPSRRQRYGHLQAAATSRPLAFAAITLPVQQPGADPLRRSGHAGSPALSAGQVSWARPFAPGQPAFPFAFQKLKWLPLGPAPSAISYPPGVSSCTFATVKVPVPPLNLHLPAALPLQCLVPHMSPLNTANCLSPVHAATSAITAYYAIGLRK